MRGKVKALSLVAKAILVLVCLVMFVPMVIHLCPWFVGADESYVILGNSMSPAMRYGDVVIVREVDPAIIDVGDVISYRTDSDMLVTHRVVEKKVENGVYFFKVKGDACEDPNTGYVEASAIVGSVSFVIPFSYVYSPHGYALLVLTPASLLIAKEFINVYRTLTRDRGRRRSLWNRFLSKLGLRDGRRWRPKTLETTSILLMLILVAGSVTLMRPHLHTPSSTYFSDTETSRGNTIIVGTWKVQSTITCQVSPSSIELGEEVTISGSINPTRSAEVIIQVSSDGTWNDLATTTSSSDGSYSYPWTPTATGSYKIRASWDGSEWYFGATSGETVVTVTG